jgi:hypothetical protein
MFAHLIRFVSRQTWYSNTIARGTLIKIQIGLASVLQPVAPSWQPFVYRTTAGPLASWNFHAIEQFQQIVNRRIFAAYQSFANLAKKSILWITIAVGTQWDFLTTNHF